MLNPVLFLALFVVEDFDVDALSLPKGFEARPLLPDKVYQCCKHEPYSLHRDLPVVYCYLGSPKIPLNTWQTVSALINLNTDQYDLYEGQDFTDVWTQFEDHRSSWSFNFMNWRRKQISLDPFNNTCLGIRTSNDYNIRLQINHVDYMRITMFLLSVVLFFLSPSLANNPIFYYLTAIAIGVLASVLILFYFILKLLPLKRPAMIGMMAGGSTIVFYLFQTFYDNILLIFYSYQEYVIGYLVMSALISFIVCYRFGPVSNPRSKNLIKWALQAFALILIFFSSHFHEAMLAADVVILSVYNIPVFRWIAGFLRFSTRVLFRAKPKARLLTEEEYRVQGEVETKRGLEELRSYCNSPNCRQWLTVMRLRDPHRFARFMEGKSHVTKEEIELYEEENKRVLYELLTDDSDDED